MSIVPIVADSAAVPARQPWQTVVTAYLDAALDSPHTRRAYRRHLIAWLHNAGVVSLTELTGTQLAAYRAAVCSSPLAPGSQAQALAALRAFLAWSRSMGAHRLPAEVVAVALRTPKATVQRPYQVLNEREISAVLAAAASARDRALLAVLLGAGLRAAEVVGLDVGDVSEDADGETLLRVHGKGRKERLVPVREDVGRLVRRYLAETKRRLGDAGPLFLNARGGRLCTRTVGKLVARAIAAGGIEAKRISPHSLRHSFAIRALRAGASVVAVSRILGHAGITVTGRYLDHLELRELRAAIPSLPCSEREIIE